MTVNSAVACAIFLTAIFYRVNAWTIDLPEVRKIHFERFDSHGHHDSYENDRNVNNNGQTFDNINGNSPHNTDDEYNYYYHNLYKDRQKHGEEDVDIYASSFTNYESYMLRKVQDAVHNGSAYLDGLRRSIERYIALLENCRRLNLTKEKQEADTRSSHDTMLCRKATEASEHVRRLAQLALHTTRRLQDVAYTSKYNKDDSMEENELLLRLAWYLDKLAHLTGYDPDPNAHTTTTRPLDSDTPSAPTPLPLPQMSEETKAAILKCLRENSSEPATVRCAYRVQQPALIDVVTRFNVSESNFRLDIPLPSRVSRRSSDDTSGPALEEILLATDNKHVPPKPAVKTIRKRSVTDSNNPLVKVLKYYAKHKVWVNSNPVIVNPEDILVKKENFDVKNSLHAIHKRSVDSWTKINKIPEDPMQDLSKYVKSKPNVHFNSDKNAEDRLKAAIVSIGAKKLISNNKIKKLTKILRTKRNVPVEVRETIKTNTDIHYDIPKDLTDKLKAALHHIPVAISHLPIEHHGHHGHIDHHGHHGHIEHLKHHLGHLEHHGHVEHIKTDIHYDHLHKEDAAEKLKAAIHHIHAKKVQIAKKIETLRKIFKPKRSVSYEDYAINPRIPQDPQGDISYYVKHKDGTNFNRDLAEAAALRTSLQAAFERGNINVVHRYGANYVPFTLPFFNGLARSLADS